MRRSDTLDIIHAANYGALCIAILRAAPTSVVDSFSLYETGKPLAGPGNRAVNHVERTREMASMREAGMTWEDIGMALGLKAPSCYFVRHKHLLGGGDRMKYKNPRTGHTIAVELVILEYAVVERDWEGKIVSILAEDMYEHRAQRKLDRLAELMKWEEA